MDTLIDSIKNSFIKQWFIENKIDPFFLDKIAERSTDYEFDYSSGNFVKPLKLEDIPLELQKYLKDNNLSNLLNEDSNNTKVSAIITSPTGLHSYPKLAEYIRISSGKGVLIQVEDQITYDNVLYEPVIIASKDIMTFAPGSIQAFGPTGKNKYLIIDVICNTELKSGSGTTIQEFYNMPFWYHLYST